MAYNKLTLKEKLLAKAEQVGDCLIWRGHTAKSGYGHIRIGGKWRRAHRVHFELEHGPIPDGMVVMHACDNPACISLAHLKLGTQTDNMRDSGAKGRRRFLAGSAHSNAKLNTAQVNEIRRRYRRYDRNNGAPALAMEFGVSTFTILAVVKNETYLP